MRSILKFVLLTIACIASFQGMAQKLFKEGTVVYNAVLTKPDGTSMTGLYTLNVKNSQVRKDLKLGPDFENVQIMDETGKAYTLRSANGKNYAIEISPEELKAKNRKYKNAKIDLQKDSKKIAGMTAKKVRMTFSDGTDAVLYFSEDWQAETDFAFERFHSLKGFPLAFDYKNDQGAVITFEATSFNENVVESGLFKVPAGYKVISSEEYRGLKTK